MGAKIKKKPKKTVKKRLKKSSLNCFLIAQFVFICELNIFTQ